MKSFRTVLGVASMVVAVLTGSPAADPLRHDFSAQRDVKRLRSGIHVHLAAAGGGGGGARIMQTNLAGHAYPAGTGRRAVRLYAGPDGVEPKLIATLRRGHPVPPLRGDLPPLAPGEQRRVNIPFAVDSEIVRYRLVYCRNIGDPAGQILEILSGAARVRTSMTSP